MLLPFLCGDLETEESEDCDLGDCTKPEGLCLSSHQGLITADAWLHRQTPGGLIRPSTGSPSQPKTEDCHRSKAALPQTAVTSLTYSTSAIKHFGTLN